MMNNTRWLLSLCVLCSLLVCQQTNSTQAQPDDTDDNVVIITSQFAEIEPEVLHPELENRGVNTLEAYLGMSFEYDRKQGNRYHLVRPKGWISADDVVSMQEASGKQVPDRPKSTIRSRSRSRRPSKQPSEESISSIEQALIQFVDEQSEEALTTINQYLKDSPEDVTALLTRATIYNELEEYESALDDLQTALEIDRNSSLAGMLFCFTHYRIYTDLETLNDVIDSQFPRELKTNPTILFARALLERTDEAYEQAHQHLQQAIERGTGNPSAWQYSGESLQRIGEYDTALQHYDVALTYFKDNDDAIEVYDLRARCYYEMGEYDLAIQDYDSILELDSENSHALLERGNTYHNLGNLEAAYDDLSAAIELEEETEAFDIPRAYFKRAMVQEDQGEPQEALLDLAECASLYESGEAEFLASDPYREMGRIYYALDDLEQTEANLLKAIEADSENTKSLRFLADFYRLERYAEKAHEYYTRVIDLDPTDSVAWNNRGISQEMLNDIELALSDYEQAIKLIPDNLTYRKNAALMLREMGKYQEADEHLFAAIELYSLEEQEPLAELHYQRGENARYAGEDELAIEHYDAAIETYADHVNSWNSRGICHDNLNQFQEAVDNYDRALELDPESPVIYVNRGDVYRQVRQNESAHNDYTRAITLDPEMPLAYNQRALLYINVGDYEAAINDLKKALDLNENYVTARINLGDALRYSGKYEESIREYSFALIEEPLNLMALYGRAECYRELNRLAEAEAGYRTILKQDRNYDLAWVGLGEVYEQDDRFEQAIRFYSNAIEITPDYLWALYRRGFSRSMINQDEESIRDFTEVLELNPEHVNARLFRANALRDLGEYQEALADYQVALELDKDFTYIYLGRGTCYELMGRYSDAVTDYNQAIKADPNLPGSYNDRARLLAAVLAPSVYNPKLALQDARKACELSDNGNPNFLATLAIALAANGDFEGAIQAQADSIDLAESLGGFTEAYFQGARERMQLYRNEEPYVLAENDESSKLSGGKKSGQSKSTAGGMRRAGSIFGSGGSKKSSRSRTKPEDENTPPAPPLNQLQ